MSNSIPNPYVPPKPPPLETREIKHRDIAIFVLLCVVTLGFYFFYIAYQWSKEVNSLVGREKYQPVVVLLVSIVTCGMAASARRPASATLQAQRFS